MNERLKVFNKGLIKENPLFIYALGICPALAVTSSADTALAMGVATAAVLTASSAAASAFKRVIPANVRIPVNMLFVATLVTLLQYIMRAYMMPLYDSLGIYLSLIVINCLIYGRMESYASRNSIVNSTLDGLGMGLGYTIALMLMGMLRELLGYGSIFGIRMLPASLDNITIFSLAPGGFFTLGVMIAAMNKLSGGRRRGCGSDCSACPASAGCKSAPKKEGDEA